MPAEAETAGPSNGKVKASKKVKEGDAVSPIQNKRKKADDVDGAAERRHKKKKRRSEAADGDEEAADMSSYKVGDDGTPETKPEKRKKKKAAAVAAAAATAAAADDAEGGPSTSEPLPEKKKKKSKSTPKDVDMTDGTVDESSAPAEPAPPKEKKEKKSKKAKSTAGGIATPVPSAAPSTSAVTIAPGATPSAAAAAAFLQKHAVTISESDASDPVVPVLDFASLAVPPELAGAFRDFKEPTPIQACTWPPALKGKDIVGIAETGSGKTLAFGIPALSHLLSSPAAPTPKQSKSKTKDGAAPQISVLVVAPTRELALQTHDTLAALGAPLGIASVAVFGGVAKDAQVRLLRSADRAHSGLATRIVVGTPGRILDLVTEGACDLSGVTYLVLDEADRMLDRGFENDIRKIISYTVQGEGRQTLMFSATWPESVRRLASTFQRDPVRVTVGSDDLTANSRVEQVLEVFDNEREKDSRLLDQLRSIKHPKTPLTGSANARVLVFVLYKKEAARVEGMLRSKGFSVQGIHGDMAQTGRIAALQSFKDGVTNTLVATDVAARGLDIPDVAVVINYSFPLTIEDYIHRIGRTGRGGKSGKSVTFFTGDNHERALAGELARVLGESGYESAELKERFPMTIKKKQHGVYGAFFRDDIPVPKGPTKIKF